jgi:DNA-binding PadR family transcriptional regulator
MRVRDALLVLLARRTSHGYQLKLDYERLTGSGAINVGQVYTTLDRLLRDGLVDREPGESDRRVSYFLTELGQKHAWEWIADSGNVQSAGRSEVAGKLLLATGVPGVDITQVIDSHRLALMALIQSTRRQLRAESADMESRMVIEAEVAVIEAELRWLDLFETELRSAESNP